ncbi:hypothetical protein [Bradyrhizobium sp. LMG 9283]|uniref:hypothetical protein n=1 Tax=Bradyrhizobium sp. LMG 9283 TaxID=592064 RepID=UPI00388DDA25
MSSISGEPSNGLPVHRIQGVSKMYKYQFDLMPLRCAIDEARRIDGVPSDVKTSTAMLDEAEELHGADRFWLVQSPRRHLPACLAQRLGRMTSANHAIASSRAKVRGAEQVRGAGLRRGMAVHFTVDQRFGG